MKNIRIRQLTLDNFKCHEHLQLQLDGGNAAIYGDNAAGKTSVYDALVWLLFGKDSQGRTADDKLCCIKPLGPDGEVKDHAAVTSVEAVLDVDGTELKLCRQLTEKWSQRRGAQQLVFDGNETAYAVDDVPCKKMEYSRKIAEVIDEDVFRMLTNLRHFPEELAWQKRRAVLFDMVGDCTDAGIMATDERFDPLRQAMGSLSLGDYQKKVAARMRGLKTDTDTLPQRIDENRLQLDSLQGIDAAGAQTALQEAEARKRKLHEELAALQQDSTAQQAQSEVNALRAELSELERANDQYRMQQKAGMPDMEAVDRKTSQLETEAKRLRQDARQELERAEREGLWAEQLDLSICLHRERWMAENGTEFAEGCCPTCGQKLPENQLARAIAAFDEEKRARLREIETAANELKAQKEATLAQHRQRRERAEELRQKADAAEQTQKELLEEAARVRAAQLPVTDLPEYGTWKAQLKAQIDEWLQEAAAAGDALRPRRAALQEKLDAVNAEIAGHMKTIARADQRVELTERIEQLRQQANKAAQELEQLAQMRYLMEEFIRYKAGFVEDGVNGLFRLTQFRLFFQQANGAIDDRCDVMHDGVPYSSLNNGMRINVGIDIVRSLSQHYGVQVPLFVDNAESVTQLEDGGMQVIRLVVSEQDKKLRMEVTE